MIFLKVVIIVIINFGQENESIDNNLDVYLEKIIFFITTLSFLCVSIVLGEKNKEDKNTIFLQLFVITLEMKSITY